MIIKNIGLIFKNKEELNIDVVKKIYDILLENDIVVYLSMIKNDALTTAIDNLAEDGYVTSSRGRYGGTFVTDIPQNSTEAYKWLAISSDYVSGN